MATSILEVTEGDFIKAYGQWQEILKIELVYRDGDLRGWYVTTSEDRYDMFDIDAYLTREEFAVQ
jgi:hypothetical protein